MLLWKLNKSEPAVFAQPPLVDTIFENGNIPINATDFLRDGVVASIPAGTQNFSINSYSQQPNVNIVLTLDDLVDANNLQIVLADGANAGTHNFALVMVGCFQMQVQQTIGQMKLSFKKL